MVVHLLTSPDEGEEKPPQVGLVVSKAVGNAVRRNKVKRRIRASAAAQLADLPAHSFVVVRALAPAATTSYWDLDADLRSCLKRAIRKADRGTHDRRQALAGTWTSAPDRRASGPTTAPGNPTNGGNTA